MSPDSQQQIASFGASIIDRAQQELGLTETHEFPELADIRNLAGASTGTVRTFTGPRLTKMTALSINVAPGARYFNIQLVPEARYNAPRFSTEGMLMAQGSQVSMDIFPDYDVFMDVQAFVHDTKELAALYDEARASGINFIPSRYPHMRVFCSPYFLNAFKARAEDLPQLDSIQNRYFSAWQKIFVAAAEVDAQAAKQRVERRRYMSDTVIALDPDRDMIVQVYGEATTSALERAGMYW